MTNSPDPYRADFGTQPIPIVGSPANPAWGVAPSEPPLVTIGDIVVTRSQVITPAGTRPIGEVHWAMTDMSRTTQTIPVWAIICAVVGFFLVCFLSLLLLLVKEWRTEGWVQVVVQGPGFMHATSMPVFSPQQAADVNARVNYARSISAAANRPR